MNRSLHLACQWQLFKIAITGAILGITMCFACGTTLAIDSSTRWADLATEKDHDRSATKQVVINAPAIAPNLQVNVHVGPAASAFTPESFGSAGHVRTQFSRRALRPLRLPPTGYFDESVAKTRIASGPGHPRVPENLRDR